jgi:hypothetical protein
MSIDPGHDPKRRSPHRCRPLVERGSRQPQERILPEDTEREVVVIDQLSQFTVVRAADTFI